MKAVNFTEGLLAYRTECGGIPSRDDYNDWNSATCRRFPYADLRENWIAIVRKVVKENPSGEWFYPVTKFHEETGSLSFQEFKKWSDTDVSIYVGVFGSWLTIIKALNK